MAAVETSQDQHGPSIDKLLDFFVANDGTAYYKVKWKPTWERADALSHFNDLVDSFWKFVNNAHIGNLSNNRSMKKGPDPVIPPNIPPNIPHQTYQQLPNNDVQPVQRSVPRKSVSRQKSNQKQNLQSNPRPQNPSKMQSLSSVSNVAISREQQRLSAPLTNNTFPEAQSSTVIIDSDDDDNSSELPSLASIQNAPSLQQQQQQQYMSPMWNMPTKIEPSELPDEKPFQLNQQQQFQFPMQNFNTNSSNVNPNGRGGNNVKARGSGRGRGGTPGAKRKQAMPSASPNKQPKQAAVKMETPDDMSFLDDSASPQIYDVSASSPPSDENSGGKWEDNFEIIEKKNFDGTKLETLYKCTVCGTVISNKSSCRRHFNIHSGEKSHKCPICNKAFHRIDYMQRHLKIHGQGSGQELESLIKLAMEGVKK